MKTLRAIVHGLRVWVDLVEIIRKVFVGGDIKIWLILYFNRRWFGARSMMVQSKIDDASSDIGMIY